MLKVMETFRIAQYGLMQTAALIYSILASGTITWVDRHLNADTSTPAIFIEAKFFATYGAFLFLVILGWASLAAFHTSIFVRKPISETVIVASGLLMTAFFVILGSYFGGFGFAVEMER